MTRDEIYDFIRAHRYGVLATNCKGAAPESALVGIAVTPAMEIVFDTTEQTRKVKNIRRDRHVSFVIGWENEQTLQVEGVADEPGGRELERLKGVYYEVWPDAPTREVWPGHLYLRLRPRWMRFSSYLTPYKIKEMHFDAP